jgi:succinate dehydrogenase / fumarate reductase, iron-sulfur subunit
MKFSIYRFQPEKQAKPFMQDYELPLTGGQDMMLLDALRALREQDPTLSFRCSCREGVCGSCGMNINGKNGLACKTKLSSLKKSIMIRPLPGRPVIRDLVVDLKDFFTQFEKAMKIANIPTKLSHLPRNQERLQSPGQRQKLDGLYECILCACCSTACPSWWWNPDKFLGPAALLWLCRFLVDSRYVTQERRLTELNDLYSLFRCKSIMNCAAVCPKGLNPAKAIGEVRRQLIAEEI